MAVTGNEHAFDLVEGIRVRASGDPHSPILDRFLAGYDRAFILPDEREEADGFRRCLAINATCAQAFGRSHTELVAVLEDGAGSLLGGANFLVTAMPGRVAGPAVTVALNYIYVERAARGKGLLRQALAAVRHLALMVARLPADAPGPTIFIEQNDPLRLSPAEFLLDTSHSGTDQIDRLSIWDRMGARIVDFPYVQPALSPGQQAEDRLIYAAIDHPGAAIGAGLLHDHLASFFAISVLKGTAEPPGGPAAAQLAMLAGRETPVALLSMGPALARLRAARDSGGTLPDASSLRELARLAGVA